MPIFLLIAVLMFGIGQAAACSLDLPLVSPSAKPLPPDKFRGINKDMPVQSIIDQLGPAARDVGSGVFLFEWDVTDGRVFFVSTSGACDKPFSTGFR